MDWAGSSTFGFSDEYPVVGPHHHSALRLELPKRCSVKVTLGIDEGQMSYA